MKKTAVTKEQIKTALEKEFGLEFIRTNLNPEPIGEGWVINAEQCEHLDYYGFFNTLGVRPELDEFVRMNGWWFEWKNSYQINLWKY